jgi:hypothetical protein
MISIVREIANSLRYAMSERHWPTVETPLLVSLWAAIALAFHFALAVSAPRYATSVVVFAWPALVAEIDKRRQAVIWLGLAVVCVVSILRSYRSVEFAWFPDPPDPMNVALKQVPMATRQVYIIKAPYTNSNPEYSRLILGVPAEIVHIIDLDWWDCRESNDLMAFDHSVTDGVVKLAVTLPACANLYFSAPIGDEASLANGRLYRNNAMSYELPEVAPAKGPFGQRLRMLGRRMTVHVRPNGPARFIIQYGGPSGIAWFDTP